MINVPIATKNGLRITPSTEVIKDSEGRLMTVMTGEWRVGTWDSQTVSQHASREQAEAAID